MHPRPGQETYNYSHGRITARPDHIPSDSQSTTVRPGDSLDEVWQLSAAYGIERFDLPPSAPVVKRSTVQRVARRAWWFAMGAGIGYLLALAFVWLGIPGIGERPAHTAWPYMLFWSLNVGFITSRTGLRFRHRAARFVAIMIVFVGALAINDWLI
jgi:hypothetical protein